MPLQVSRVATAPATRFSGSSLQRGGDFAPQPAERSRGARSDQLDEFVGADHEAAVGIHLPNEPQRIAALRREFAVPGVGGFRVRRRGGRSVALQEAMTAAERRPMTAAAPRSWRLRAVAGPRLRSAAQQR